MVKLQTVQVKKTGDGEPALQHFNCPYFSEKYSTNFYLFNEIYFKIKAKNAITLFRKASGNKPSAILSQSVLYVLKGKESKEKLRIDYETPSNTISKPHLFNR